MPLARFAINLTSNSQCRLNLGSLPASWNDNKRERKINFRSIIAAVSKFNTFVNVANPIPESPRCHRSFNMLLEDTEALRTWLTVYLEPL